MKAEHASIIERVRKLLALSRSDNPHEAASAAAKAQALLSEYNLSMSDIPAEDRSGLHVGLSGTKTRQRLELWAFRLAHATAKAFDCKYIHYADGITKFFGVGADPEVCSWTFHYLYKTLLRMGSSYLRSPQCRRLRKRQSKDSARSSYLIGAVFVVARRLMEQREITPVTEAALVPVKAEAIRAELPDFTTKTFKPSKCRDNDWVNGAEDGRKIPLSTPLNHSEHSIPLE